MEADKKKLALNIVSSKVNHKGFGAGAIDLSNVSGVIIDGDEAYLDEGTLHAKSKIEKGIKFSTNKEDVPNGRKAGSFGWQWTVPKKAPTMPECPLAKC